MFCPRRWLQTAAGLGMLGGLAALFWLQPGLANQETRAVDVHIGVGDTVLVVGGTTSPDAFVTIREGNATIGTTTADNDGEFSKTLTAQTPGSRNITVFAQDTAGSVSDSVTVNVNVQSHSTTTLDLFLPPTITLSHQQLQQGEVLSLHGQTAVGAQVVLVLDDNHNTTVNADSEGHWQQTINTASLSVGTHSIFARAITSDGNQSFPTLKRQFAVTAEPVPPTPVPPVPTPPDPDVPAIQVPTITYPAHNQTFFYNNIEVRGLSGPGVRIELFDGDKLIGAVYSDLFGNWRLQLTLAKASYELRARACVANTCSDFSPMVRIFYSPVDTGPIFTIDLQRLVFTTSTRRSIKLNVSYHNGQAPYELVIDWGDGEELAIPVETEHSSHRHRYLESGTFSGSVRAIAADGQEAQVHFAVAVNHFSWLHPSILLMILLIILILLLYIWLLFKRRRRDKDEEQEEKSALENGTVY